MRTVKGLKHRTVRMIATRSAKTESRLVAIRVATNNVEDLYLDLESRSTLNKITEAIQLTQIVVTRCRLIIEAIDELCDDLITLNAPGFAEFAWKLKNLSAKIDGHRKAFLQMTTRMTEDQRSALLQRIEHALDVVDTVLSVIDKIPLVDFPVLRDLRGTLQALNALVVTFDGREKPEQGDLNALQALLSVTGVSKAAEYAMDALKWVGDFIYHKILGGEAFDKFLTKLNAIVGVALAVVTDVLNSAVEVIQKTWNELADTVKTAITNFFSFFG